MNTKTLSNRALSVIDQYLHFKVGNAVCAVPYFNNKTVGSKVALRAHIGKGSPKDIFEEVQTFAVKNHISMESLADESLKKLLVDDDLGIDCSAFTYYVLNAESEEVGKGSIDKHISFTNRKGFFGKLISSMRPVENIDVTTLANDKNSRVVLMKEIQPGDFISMVNGPEGPIRNHILVIHQVEYQNFIPTHIHYSHAAAYPEDGVYGTGVKQGTISILNPEDSLFKARWTENGNENGANQLYNRATKSKTEVRRLNWF